MPVLDTPPYETAQAELDALYDALEPATALQIFQHQQRLLALPVEAQTSPSSPDFWPEQHANAAMVRFVSRRAAANRENATFSTGPRSIEGLLKSSLNAQRHGLTGRTILLASEDANRYERHCQSMLAIHQPAGDEELILVRKIADTEWRLERIPSLEAALYAEGRMRFTADAANFDPALQADLIDLQTYSTYEKTFRNIHIQEGRLNRLLDKSKAELKQLQGARRQRETEQRQQPQPKPQQATAPVQVTEADLERARQRQRERRAAHEQQQQQQNETPNPNGFVFTDRNTPGEAKQ